MEMKAKLWEKIFATYVINKGSVHQMYNKQFLKIETKSNNQTEKKIAKKVHRQFTEVVS